MWAINNFSVIIIFTERTNQVPFNPLTEATAFLVLSFLYETFILYHLVLIDFKKLIIFI